MSDFYIGYLLKAPSALGRFLRKAVVWLGLLAVTAALTLVLGQGPFAHSTFEYGKPRTFEGMVVTQPYPSLLVLNRGDRSPGDKFSQYLLVAPGKHGAGSLLSRFAGRHVRLQGQLIDRDGEAMLEVVPGSIDMIPGSAEISEEFRDLGPVTVAGEIVDSKCYLGVMNPGSGKVHRDCAARCLSGGIPPLFITANGESLSGSSQFLLVGRNGKALESDSLREFVAEQITVKAELLQRGEAKFLQIDPDALRHADKD